MRRSGAVLLFALAAALAARPAPAADPVQRVALEGETLDTLELEIVFDGIDWTDAAAVARAKAGIDAVLQARLEIQLALVLGAEFAREYRELVDPAALRREAQREDLEDARRQSALVAGATIEAVLGKAETPAENRVVYPLLVTARAEGKELFKNRCRIDLARVESGQWRVIRDETLCADCEGSGKRREKSCAGCDGRGWVANPHRGFPEGLHAERPLEEVGPSTPRDSAIAFLSRRLALSRWLLAGFAAKVGPAYREYCTRFFAPGVLGAPETPSVFTAQISYEPGEEIQDGSGASVMVRETITPAQGKAESTWIRVNVLSPVKGRWLVSAFGLSCPACQGSGKCAQCRGTGLEAKGNPCPSCEGMKTCLACQGKRIVPAELLSPRW